MVNADFSVTDGVARVEIRRPEALNAVDMPTKLEMIDRLRDYRDDDDVRVVVLQSEGDAFSAGGDLAEVPENDYELEPFTETWEEMFTVMTGMDQPIVAKVDGYTLGGGFDLLLHTDIPIASHDAQLGQPESSLGIVNHFSPPLLNQRLGRTKTLDMMLTGDTISGREAARIGLVARSVPADDLDDEVDDVVDSLRSKSPRVLAALKEGIYTTTDMTPGAARSYMEAVSLEHAREHPDYREGVDAQLEDREPEWEA